MRRLLILGFLAGLLLVIVGAALYPLPDHERFRSRIEVLQNGGRAESFVIRWPQDRIALPAAPAGSAPAATPGTAVLEGPTGSAAAAELFRLRDIEGQVIGIASRVTGQVSTPRARTVSQWLLAIPGRGSLILVQENAVNTGPSASADGYLVPAEVAGFWSPGPRLRITAGPETDGAGRILRGTEEFAALTGSYTEFWELEEIGSDGRTEGRIVLSTVTVARR